MKSPPAPPPTDVPTIFALSSAPGRAGVAVTRVSGPHAEAALCALTGRTTPPAPRRAVRARFRDPATGEVLDDGLVLFFPGPDSFTGEDVAEFQGHGGRATTRALLDALAGVPGLEPAEPGAFTRRAFDAGKLDLTAVEGLADLIDAETAAQRRQALRQMGGALARLTEGWRDRLVRALAHLEATIDFSDEDLPEALLPALQADVAALVAEITAHLAAPPRGERLRDGVHVAILGPPNAGKSSLVNALARREAAIVSAIAGTTRDVVEVHLDLDGFPVVLADTAGLRESADVIEQEGVRRAHARAAAADVRLVLLDGGAGDPLDPAVAALTADPEALVVLNKTDLRPDGAQHALALPDGRAPLGLSLTTGAGFEALLAAVTDRVRALAEAGAGAPPPLTRARHRHALAETRDALTRALDAPLPELVAEDLRLAVRALGRITGRVDVEDLLDVIFRDFCIGK
ncbi:tRNA uridine-5-carboxymethylaminomethyl(34) synthesis GTPase MnmE [Roseospira marina]|uniref:tRNA modification GTPase MnmE n=1 Tax=Roseospira marina TaxID=140057 RepID=A0A5M6IDZ7_9PROT|nr:tRNA uridine-5-carboxymethylaminomethyl(34) synthesis GTPase MnmE [Roseospira marina]KAA5606510.1 tRNA uridine-5-carboxymethylaminomethyl(34) synthesis GTPase MnmE [Roseospira marina]MBB4314067.1 tRNA modification GTPase [Roseospira marina]MBB5087228.1 tRNA modification GTPase [Roseospira marina]